VVVAFLVFVEAFEALPLQQSILPSVDFMLAFVPFIIGHFDSSFLQSALLIVLSHWALSILQFDVSLQSFIDCEVQFLGSHFLSALSLLSAKLSVRNDNVNNTTIMVTIRLFIWSVPFMDLGISVE
jgi:hypothetical protein